MYFEHVPDPFEGQGMQAVLRGTVKRVDPDPDPRGIYENSAEYLGRFFKCRIPKFVSVMLEPSDKEKLPINQAGQFVYRTWLSMPLSISLTYSFWPGEHNPPPSHVKLLQGELYNGKKLAILEASAEDSRYCRTLLVFYPD